MRDLIDRQKLLEALDKLIPSDPMKDDYTKGITVGVARATGCVEKFSQENGGFSQGLVKDLMDWQKIVLTNFLPSAQPDLQPTCNQLATDCISRQATIDAIVKCTNCNTPEVLREYVAEHSLWLLWSGGVLEALEAVEGLPSAPLYTPDELQTMQDLEWAQMEKMYELGKAEHKKGKWVGKEQFTNSPEFYSWQCSVCGCVLEDPTMDKPYPFCPHCGADMREGEQE